jgi:hypothetical protein
MIGGRFRSLDSQSTIAQSPINNESTFTNREFNNDFQPAIGVAIPPPQSGTNVRRPHPGSSHRGQHDHRQHR